MHDLIVIEAGRLERNYWLDLWRYRELFRVLAWRDLSVRYKQTAPAVRRNRPLPAHDLRRYPAMDILFFSSGLSEASNSLINNANLISKVYFPRLIVPMATVVVAFVDFLISFFILVLLMAWYNFLPDWRMLLLPVFIVLAFFASVGPALWITALNVKYRDFRHVIPFIVQFGLYVSPVGFSSNVVPEQWRLLYSLNPMVGIIDGFRWCILGGQSELYVLAMSFGVTAFFFGSGSSDSERWRRALRI
jgi:lipopolysaccharide transport system permease protein